MKMFNELTLKSIKSKLEKIGVGMKDEEFYSLTYSELKTIYRKGKKAYKLYGEIDTIIHKPNLNPAPDVPKKIVKGA